MALVSIIVPVYNIKKYIEQCIESLLKQTCHDLEIILVDDGSTDGCSEICDRYQELDSRIRVIHKPNGGISDARNAGIREVHGKYFLFVDGDDYVADTLVEETLQCAEENNADLVLFDFAEVEEDTGRTDRWQMNVERGKVFNAGQKPELLISTPSPCNKLYKSEFFARLHIEYPLGRNYEDLAMTPRVVLQAERIVYLDSGPLYYYMLHTGSIMRSRNYKKSYDDRKDAIDQLISYFKEQGADNRFRDELEYMAFQHMFFIPSKEIILEAPGNEYLAKFREYIEQRFPGYHRNHYIEEELSGKDKLLLRLMRMRLYGVMRILSRLRKIKDGRKSR